MSQNIVGIIFDLKIGNLDLFLLTNFTDPTVERGWSLASEGWDLPGGGILGLRVSAYNGMIPMMPMDH